MPLNEAIGSFYVPIASDKNSVALNICDTNLLPGLTGFKYRLFRIVTTQSLNEEKYSY